MGKPGFNFETKLVMAVKELDIVAALFGDGLISIYVP